jgi:cytoskeleton protein RodZ
MPETIGQQLKQARQAKNLTIQKVVQATHIRAPHIEALEADNFDSLPSPVQARAFLRLYAEYLGLSVDTIIDRQRAGLDGLPENSADPELAPTQNDKESNQQSLDRSADMDGSNPISISTKGRQVWTNIINLIMRGRQLLARSSRRSSQQELTEIPEQSESRDNLEPEVVEIPQPVEQPPATGSAPLQSQIIFIEVGKALCQRRESLSLTLDEIERHIHVRTHYLKALEEGEFSQLPSSVQARGMLNNYARFLDLDVDALLLKFADGLQIQRVERQTGLEQTSPKIGGRSRFNSAIPSKGLASIRRFLSLDILVGGGLIILLVVFAVWGTGRIINLRSDTTPLPTAPSISGLLISSPESSSATPSLTSTGNAVSVLLPASGETPVVTIPASGNGAVNVVVIAQNQTWVRVTVDFKVMFEGLVTPGTAYPYDANTQIEVLTGNGIAISILYNQGDLGPMGVYGEVVDRIYTSKAILVPTATFTATPTITRTPTPTRKPTLTLVPSATRKFTLTPGP